MSDKQQFSIRRNAQGHAEAIERNGHTVLLLATGAERNEQEAAAVVARLNATEPADAIAFGAKMAYEQALRNYQIAHNQSQDPRITRDDVLSELASLAGEHYDLARLTEMPSGETEPLTVNTLATDIMNSVLGHLPEDIEPRTLWMGVCLAMNLVLRRIPVEEKNLLDEIAFVKAILGDSPIADVWPETEIPGESKQKPIESKQKPLQETLYCSFCGKSQHEVRKLIAGPTVFICDECVELCVDIIEESKDAPPATG